MNGISVLAAALSVSVVATGCSGVSNQQLGAGLGAAVGTAGGVLAAKAFGGGSTAKVLGALGGAAAGGVIGYQVAKMLDERDRPAYNAATEKALETDQGQVWKNPETGNSGKIEVVKETTGPQAAPASTTQAGPTPISTAASGTPAQSPAPASSSKGIAAVGQCKTVRQTITLKDGTTREEEVKACKGPNGWEPVG